METPNWNVIAAVVLLAAASPGETRLFAQSNLASERRQFRGPNGQAISQNKGLPTTWNADQNLVWKTPLPGAGGSSPNVFGDRIYLTCYSGYAVPGSPGGDLSALQRHVLCIQRTDGKISWRKDIPAAQPEQANVREHGYASSTPLADADRLYVFFGKSGVFAFSHGGEQLWHADVGSKIHGWGSAASPVLYQDLVIINAAVESDSLVALKKATGKVVFEERLTSAGQFYASPILADGRLYCVGRRGGVFVLAAKPQFEQLARNDLADRGSFDASPAVDGSRLLIRSDRYLYCLGAK